MCKCSSLQERVNIFTRFSTRPWTSKMLMGLGSKQWQWGPGGRSTQHVPAQLGGDLVKECISFSRFAPCSVPLSRAWEQIVFGNINPVCFQGLLRWENEIRCWRYLAGEVSMKTKGRKQEKVDRAYKQWWRSGEEGKKGGQFMKSVRLQQSSKKLQPGWWGAPIQVLNKMILPWAIMEIASVKHGSGQMQWWVHGTAKGPKVHSSAHSR